MNHENWNSIDAGASFDQNEELILVALLFSRSIDELSGKVSSLNFSPHRGPNDSAIANLEIKNHGHVRFENRGDEISLEVNYRNDEKLKERFEGVFRNMQGHVNSIAKKTGKSVPQIVVTPPSPRKQFFKVTLPKTLIPLIASTAIILGSTMAWGSPAILDQSSGNRLMDFRSNDQEKITPIMELTPSNYEDVPIFSDKLLKTPAFEKSVLPMKMDEGNVENYPSWHVSTFAFDKSDFKWEVISKDIRDLKLQLISQQADPNNTKEGTAFSLSNSSLDEQLRGPSAFHMKLVDYQDHSFPSEIGEPESIKDLDGGFALLRESVVAYSQHEQNKVIQLLRQSVSLFSKTKENGLAAFMEEYTKYFGTDNKENLEAVDFQLKQCALYGYTIATARLTQILDDMNERKVYNDKFDVAVEQLATALTTEKAEKLFGGKMRLDLAGSLSAIIWERNLRASSLHSIEDVSILVQNLDLMTRLLDFDQVPE